ncbi:hypothetical protein M9H77_35073 [Catharanthus roseus]|uniref:Uncharacterized protein n=1 Tax=Catharanthus roseus TaxID=4058 RepID=A0ACB9ZN96_CATRO|nr:hypothetical protein M9H77_35073 [Catharanthus roseus]
MEEVLAHVHPGPIVPDVLTRDHEHRSGLIWSGDHETCFAGLQCRRFCRNLFQCYSTATRRLVVVYGSFRRCTTDRGSLSHITNLGMVMYPCIAASTYDRCQDDPLTPLGAIWCTSFDCSQLPTHTLFVWLPYYDRALVPSDLSRAVIPLICYEIVEYHYPRHVIR